MPRFLDFFDIGANLGTEDNKVSEYESCVIYPALENLSPQIDSETSNCTMFCNNLTKTMTQCSMVMKHCIICIGCSIMMHTSSASQL